ncbi:DUF3307 domain-containing protein [Croceimicrobium sp.]|uniref:DUF3307 domain-containing protein n=1 Tax=Croceimicrobium sp. TaxID=2828340 RepID=UPI003BAA50FB
MITLFLQLLLAHFLGDFVFQSHAWAEAKALKGFKSRAFYYHILVHALLLILCTAFQFELWPWWILVVFSHALIDQLKYHFRNWFKALPLFIADQLAHISILALASFANFNQWPDFSFLQGASFISLILALIFVSFVSSLIMRLVMQQWVLDEDPKAHSLAKAGLYIGVLERLFVFGFIVLNQWQAIGLLIAAKSVFRFGDLSRAKDRKLTEYVLIGTLLSFALAMATGLIYLEIIKVI